MKKSRKVLCSIIAVFMLFAVAVSAFAATGAEQKNSALSITVKTDKDSYKSFSAAKITVTVTNTSNEDIQNLSAEAVFDDLTPVGRKSQTTAEAKTLKAGESLSFSYKAILNQENFKLNIFEKILAFFVKLFNMGYKADTHDFNDGRSFVSQSDTLTFGKNEAENIVKVWCSFNPTNQKSEEGFNDKELDDMETVDSAIDKIKSSDDFSEKNEKERKETIQKALEELKKKGLINHLVYDSKTESFIFMYSSGISGGFDIKPYKNSVNWWDLASATKKQTNENSNRIIQHNLSNKKRAFISYGWDDDDQKFRKFQSDNSTWFEEKGISTTISRNTTIENYKTALSNQDLVWINEHGETIKLYDFFGIKNPFWGTSETIYTITVREKTNKENDKKYQEDLKDCSVFKRNNAYQISPEFFTKYYKNRKLQNTIIFIGSCSGFGTGQDINYNFSDCTSRECGASAVIGFHNDVIIGYTIDFTVNSIENIINGMTITEAVRDSKKQIGNSDCDWVRRTFTDQQLNENQYKDLKEIIEEKERNNLQATPYIGGNSDYKWETDEETITSYQVGDLIKFGSYPQSRVTDEETISALDGVRKIWKSYEYYSGTGSWADGNMKPSDYMKYADFSYNGEKYRAVTFSAYRPFSTGYTQTASNSHQPKNGYSINNTYYFKYEPLLWRVLNPETGYIMCENIIDAQAYQNTVYCNTTYSYDSDYWQDKSMNAFANDYSVSSIRTWLNQDFYNTAFNDIQKGKITISSIVHASDSKYSTTQDKVFLLSFDDATDKKHGFDASPSNYDEGRRAKGTDYAKCQGLYVYSGGTCNGNSFWWLRSPGLYKYTAYGVHFYGSIEGGHDASVYGVSRGVRPACHVSVIGNDNTIEEENVKFSDLPSEYLFTAGVGAWDTSFTLHSDGSFEGIYHDWDASSSNQNKYPNGSYVYSTFNGRFKPPIKQDSHSYVMKIDYLNVDNDINKVYYGSGTEYIESEPYGLIETQEFILYMPGTNMAEVDEDYTSWLQLSAIEKNGILSDKYVILCNPKEKCAFLGYYDQGNAS